MKKSPTEAVALIAGSIGSVVTMIFHPTGHDLSASAGEAFHFYEWLTMATHSLGLVSYPLLFFGFLGLYGRLGGDRLLNGLSLLSYGVAGVAVLSAGVFSGLISPELFARMASTGDEAARQIWESLITYNSLQNRAFAWVYIVASSLAFLGWSVALLKANATHVPAGGGRLLAWGGCLVGAGALLAFVFGYLGTDVHSFGLFVFAQAIWSTALGVAWLRERPEGVQSE